MKITDSQNSYMQSAKPSRILSINKESTKQLKYLLDIAYNFQ